jgi:hypothetical protein
MPAAKEKLSVARPDSRRPATEVSHEEIAVRAYCIYLDRGAADGYDLSDWLLAESQLRVENTAPTLSAKGKSA